MHKNAIAVTEAKRAFQCVDSGAMNALNVLRKYAFINRPIITLVIVTQKMDALVLIAKDRMVQGQYWRILNHVMIITAV